MSDGLEAELRRLDEVLRGSMRTDWERTLPFDELISDRWARARELGFGEGSSIYALSYVYGPVSVGRDVWIGPYTLLDGTGGLTIGDHTTISAGVHIYSHDTVKRTLSGGEAPIDRAPVSVGARTYIGAAAVIAKGVTIGDQVVIGASAFVNRDIPAFTVAAGSPARAIGRVVEGADGSIQLKYDRSDVTSLDV
jgi:acetyltransferase-like isoleucine patch superfamily enzyme